MNDSELDFVDLCTKALKRVRKKPDDSRQPRGAVPQSSRQFGGGDDDSGASGRRRRRKQGPACQPAGSRGEKLQLCGPEAGDAVSSGDVSGSERAADKVLDRMQQFRRDSPQKMHNEPTGNHKETSPPSSSSSSSSSSSALSTQHQRGDFQPFSPDLQEALPEDGDEALALRLQQELDKEAQIVDLEDGGLFFCQICHKDLSHMTPEGRTQHLNRCLDESEGRVPAPAPGVLDCPICGKKFKSQKSCSVHLKRCSSEMGVAPAVLLQALQRQAEEGQSTVSSANTNTQTLGSKRNGPPKPGLPMKKKPRTKPPTLDEETLMALALSSSLQQQKREWRGGQGAERLPVLKWQQEAAGRGRGKRRRGGVPLPPPLLLVQDAEAALTRLQERVSALLLHGRAPSPPTPTRRPSTLPGREGAAPLWQKSFLQDGASGGVSEYYSAELREFFTSSGSAVINARLDKPESSVKCAREESPSSVQPPSYVAPPTAPRAPPTPGVGQLLVGSQALQDLMELAEDGMVLTQCRCDGTGQQVSAGQTTNLRLSGFVQEDELCASGFLPETELRHLDAHRPASMATDQRRATRWSHGSGLLSRLASDLSSMVNNPQLSDVQLQVDSGEVFFAHSFMVYARCPLLAEMVHESGFGVQEEGLLAARRVLMSDVPNQAVLALLQYLYTGRCSVPASLQPHVLELASRFDLQELQQLCQLRQEEEVGHTDQEDNDQTDRAFMELLRSMWVEGEEEDEGTDSDGGRSEVRHVEEDHQADKEAADNRETSEEQVNEKELEEIYEFAATQRRKEEEYSEEEEEEEERLHDGGESKLSEPKRGFCDERLQPDWSLDRSYNRLLSESWGVYEEGDFGTSKTQPSQPKQSANKPSPQLSCRTVLQSSVDNFSFSPPPSSSNLPVAGLSPRQPDTSSRRGDDVELDEPTKPERPGSRSISIPPSPRCPKQPSEPELIVLSDSNEDMEVDVAVLSPSPPSPRAPHNPQSDTEITCRRTPPAVESKEPSGGRRSPGDPPDCSPEVSWLIPSTPLQPGRSTASSSTQTRSSMCRTQLFPMETPPPLSCVSSSPASPPHISGPNAASPRNNCSAEMFGPPRMKQSHLSSFTSSASFRQNTPLPHSSTPLNTEHWKPPALLPASPLHRYPGEAGRSETPTAESLHLSPASSSRPQNHNEFTQRAAEARRGDKLTEKRVVARRVRGCVDADTADGETREAGEAESSFQLSFTALDEPPLALNDSCGLDADAGADQPPGCFSLRLEASGPSSSSSSSSSSHPAPSSHTIQSVKSHGAMAMPLPPNATRLQSSSSPAPKPGPSSRPSPPDPTTMTEFDKDLLDSKIWESWEEEEEEEVLPLSQRVNPSAQLKTPTSSRGKPRPLLAPVTPMPHYSDMDTPELKNKLNRFGVRPLPKRQMVLKLKEIHQYTHQLTSSDSEEEAHRKPRPCSPGEFREPQAPPPLKHHEEEEDGEEELLSTSQGSNTSSTAASEESERSNPELCVSSEGGSDSDGGALSSQAASRLQERLLAVRSFILSDADLYSRILHYEPLVLSQLRRQLKAAGIRLGAAKLIDYLDSQCITFTTAGGRRQGGKRPRAAGRGGVRRKRGGAAVI